MQQITKPQLVKLSILINQLHLQDQKAAMVSSISKGRTESSKELSIDEARLLISYLDGIDNSDNMRRKIFALAYDAGIIYGDTPADKRMNAAKLNMFLKERGTVKKELNKMQREELIKTINQFVQIIKHQQQNSATKATKNLLDELNIKSSFKTRSKAI